MLSTVYKTTRLVYMTPLSIRLHPTSPTPHYNVGRKSINEYYWKAVTHSNPNPNPNPNPKHSWMAD
jgi:hypothetical protein